MSRRKRDGVKLKKNTPKKGPIVYFDARAENADWLHRRRTQPPEHAGKPSKDRKATR